MFYSLILILATLMATGKSLLCKAIGGGSTTKREQLIINLKAFFVAFLCSLLFACTELDKLFTISSFSHILSIFFGLSVSLTQLLQTRAMGTGPASTVTLIYSCGFLIPIFYGVAFWDERISVFQWIGVILLVPSLALSIGKKEKSITLKWIPFALLAMLGSGANAIFQKTHQYSEFSNEISLFLVCCLFYSTVFTALACLLVKPEVREKKQGARQRILLPLCQGAFVGSLNFLNLMLSGKIPSVIQFPVYNVGSMLLISILSAVIYKEKTTKIQWLGFFIGIIAILVIGLL